MSYNELGPVQMFNDGAYIRVENSTASTVVNYIKATLLIQRDNGNRFFLKNDSYIAYYNYTDVSLPVSTDVNDLISQLTSWNNGTETVQIGNSNIPVTITNTPDVNITNTSIPTTLPASMMDSMSRLKVSYPQTTILNISPLYDKTPRQVTEIIANGASTSNDFSKGMVAMSLSSNVGSLLTRQSKLYAPYVHGATHTALISGVLINNVSIMGATSRIGVFDDASNNNSGQPIGNGMFFQWDTTGGLSVVHRTCVSGAMQDTVVQQASWNRDIFNGTGASGINWDITDVHTFVFEWNQAIPGTAKLGIFGHRNDTNEDTIVWCHQFSNAQPFGNPSLPVRWQIFSDSGNLGGLSMMQGDATIYASKHLQEPNRIRQASLGNDMVLINTPATVPLLSIKLRSGCERAKLRPRSIQIANIAGGGYGYWSLVLNQNFNTTNWTNVETTSSFASWDNTATEASGGIVLTSGFIYNASVQTINLEDYDIKLMSDIMGICDTLTIMATNLNGVLNLSASIDWYEQP